MLVAAGDQLESCLELNMQLLYECDCVWGCRYAAGDQVESWLLELLCLNAAEHVPKLPARLPHPTECDLYYINRDTLFSYHKVGLHEPHLCVCVLDGMHDHQVVLLGS